MFQTTKVRLLPKNFVINIYFCYSYSEGTEELASTGYQLALAYTRAAVQDSDAESKWFGKLVVLSVKCCVGK